MISFIIPTFREPEKYLNAAIESIRNISHKDSYEILVCSPTEIKDVRWFEDTKCTGSIQPINFMAENAKGDYIIVGVDDHIFDHRIYAAIDFLESSTGVFKVTTAYDVQWRFERQALETISSEGIESIIVSFPIFHRGVLEHLGGKIFHPAFKHRWADNWLGWYIAAMGEPIQVSNEAYYHGVEFANSRDVDDEWDKKVFYSLTQSFKPGKYLGDVNI